MVRNGVTLPGQQRKERLLENFVGVGDSDVHAPLKMFALIVYVCQCKFIRLLLMSDEGLFPECRCEQVVFIFTHSGERSFKTSFQLHSNSSQSTTRDISNFVEVILS